MPLQATSGTASYDAFGGGAAVEPVYIEQIFQTYLYTGNGSTQTITNGIDLSGKGGLVWIKARSAIDDNIVCDTVKGVGSWLKTNTTAAQGTNPSYFSSFNSDGFSIGTNNSASGRTYASWTFRRQPKFFDVVTYTGDGTVRQIAHSLTSAPAVIMVKRTDAAANWQVWHKDVAAAGFGAMNLNSTAAAPSGNYVFRNSSFQTSTQFGVDADATVNASGGTYVAYLFAHNAGGFGLTGTDNVVSCGSYTGNGSGTGPVVTLGYEPQWLMIKNATTAGDGWVMFDNMRGMPVGSADALLLANTSGAETSGERLSPTATGFQITSTVSSMNNSGSTYIYIAIRRGPMKVPTSGTSVFSPVARAGTSTATTVTTGFPVDFIMSKGRNPSVGYGENWGEFDRLRGLAVLSSNNTGTEFTSPTYQLGIADFANNTGMNLSASDNDYGYINKSGYNYGTYFLRRAPSFFDEVCYTGTGSARTVAHNLGVAPELMIVKSRSNAFNWSVYNASIGATNYLYLNLTTASSAFSGFWNDTSPTASVFSVGGIDAVNGSGFTYVAYLFATCAGVSKVTSFTGNGSSQTINCGFTGGARFVLIKRTDSTGNWVTFDTARGIVSGNDPALYLNSTAAEVTGVDAIDTDSTGFIVNQESTFNLNVSSATYLVLAIA